MLCRVEDWKAVKISQFARLQVPVDLAFRVLCPQVLLEQQTQQVEVLDVDLAGPRSCNCARFVGHSFLVELQSDDTKELSVFGITSQIVDTSGRNGQLSHREKAWKKSSAQAEPLTELNRSPAAKSLELLDLDNFQSPQVCMLSTVL